MALTLKEINQFQIGDYVVHIDHGIGKFAGLVRLPVGQNIQEVIKLTLPQQRCSVCQFLPTSKYKGKKAMHPQNRMGAGEKTTQI